MKPIKKAMFFLLAIIVLSTSIVTVDARPNHQIHPQIHPQMNKLNIKNNIAVVVTPVITITNVFSIGNSGDTNTIIGVDVNSGVHQ